MSKPNGSSMTLRLVVVCMRKPPSPPWSTTIPSPIHSKSRSWAGVYDENDAENEAENEPVWPALNNVAVRPSTARRDR